MYSREIEGQFIVLSRNKYSCIDIVVCSDPNLSSKMLGCDYSCAFRMWHIIHLPLLMVETLHSLRLAKSWRNLTGAGTILLHFDISRGL